MSNTPQIFTEFTKLLKSTVTQQANVGILVAMLVAIFSTLLVTFMDDGQVTLQGIGEAQRTNFALWVLDVMPVVFGLWGQYAGSLLAYAAGALVVDQTSILRSQAEALEVQVQRGSNYDRLTDLPNRTLFHDRVEQAIHSAHRNEETLAVLVVDLDDFKEINNTLGHLSGDLLLKQFALRLQSVVRETDTVARLGSDEFALLLTALNKVEDAQLVAHKLCEVMEPKFALGGISLNMLMSIGVVYFPSHSDNVDALLQKAEVALEIAKQRKGCSIETYSTKLDTHSTRKLTLMSELRRTIENGELLLHYQPKVDLVRHRIVAFEALVRWNHPQHGLLPPQEFISMAERTGYIIPMTYWIIDRALAQCARWQSAGFPVDVAVNVPVSVLLDRDLPKRLVELLHKHQLVARRLVVEITESSLMEDQEYALQLLTHLSALGIRISIDDFGTGYSSLAYLRRLPVSEIKIDQSFVMGMLESDNDAVIVHATIGLAHNLGMTVIAEGVAEAGIMSKLAEWHCDLAQGHFISPPVDAAGVTQLLNGSEWGGGAVRPAMAGSRIS